MNKRNIDYKVCPLLICKATEPSLTIEGQSFTRTWFDDCLKENCVAYRGGECGVYCTDVQKIMKRNDGEGEMEYTTKVEIVKGLNIIIGRIKHLEELSAEQIDQNGEIIELLREIAGQTRRMTDD